MAARRARYLAQAGFSLLEILIALSLMGVAMSFVGAKVYDQLQEGKQQAARIQMNSLAERLKEYRRDCNNYPDSLDALVEKPTEGKACKGRYRTGGYLDGKLPKDPWGNDYAYTAEGSNFNIYSLGADGEEGGEGFDEDIYLNEDLAPKKDEE